MSEGIQLVVGLGNPGPDYENTRHNAGAWLVEQLARQQSISLSKHAKYPALLGRGTINGQDIRLLIPTTYMNLSGQAVGPVAHFFKIPAPAILVAHDELDIAPGTARLKSGGGHGGHNGLRDIIEKLGNDKSFQRLRIGIGHPGNARLVSNYVLTKPPQQEREYIEQAIDETVRVLPDILSGNHNSAMNRLHRFNAQN